MSPSGYTWKHQNTLVASLQIHDKKQIRIIFSANVVGGVKDIVLMY